MVHHCRLRPVTRCLISVLLLQESAFLPMHTWTTSSWGTACRSPSCCALLCLIVPLKGLPSPATKLSLKRYLMPRLLRHTHTLVWWTVHFPKRWITIVNSLPASVVLHRVCVIIVEWLVITILQLPVAGTDVRKRFRAQDCILKSTLQSIKVRSREGSSNSFLLLKESLVHLSMSVLITEDLSIRDDAPWYI